MTRLLKQHWNSLVVVAACLMAMFSRFVIIPPYGLNSGQWYHFGTFVVAIAIGLWLVPVSLWSKKKYVFRWWLLSGVCAIASILVFLHYTSIIDSWTVTYFKNDRVVVGSTLTPDAKAYKKQLAEKGEPVDDLSLLRDYAGRTDAVWQMDDIDRRSHSLAYWYLGVLMSLGSAVVTVTQAAYSQSNSK